MSEWKLFEGEVPYVSTAAFHADRERAPHLEQEYHRPRLELAAEFVRQAASDYPLTFTVHVSDLGCGDGGLLSLFADDPLIAWGYDFCPANAPGWKERGVNADALDVFGTDRPRVVFGDVVVMTETLEHLADPHEAVAWARRHADWLVCSSPWNENSIQHCAEHAWAWNPEGYAAMIINAGWEIVRHEQAGLFQVVLAR